MAIATAEAPIANRLAISEGVKKLIYTSVSPRVELEFD